ncbi:WXG100 family type VII secretion target [Thermomonospora catenispora]|uniref:WXG100 family type VII secretion target n=1 Tax=Thermomonospora catenispora TaxID=2493090 RepID=UPI00112125F7|nr:type VII secretion target [Thermomonospora catenispora]TNY36682.1 PE domain-containing protein [Thermomonospora catenispora]
MSDYRIQAQSMRTAAGELERAAERLAEQWKAMLATVRGMGEPWGSDDIGVLIGTSYQAVEAQADESLTGVSRELGSMAEGLRQAADNHQKAEEKSTETVSKVYQNG